MIEDPPASTDGPGGAAPPLPGAAHPVPVSILPNRALPGPAGSLALGFTWALAQGFPLVATLDLGEAEPARTLESLVAPLRSGTADAVLGATAASGGRAAASLVDRLLGSLVRRAVGVELPATTLPVRAITAAALKAIPFDLARNGPRFGIDLAIQMAAAGVRVAVSPAGPGALARPPALPVLRSVGRCLLQRTGILYERRYDPPGTGNRHYALKLGYASSHQWALDAVPDGASVLDIGAGPFGLSHELLKKGCRVGMVDAVPFAEAGPGVVSWVQDLDEPLRFEIAGYRYLLLLDIIEHLKDPELFLKRLRAQQTDEPRTMVLTTPNVAFVAQRLTLLLGQFNYGKAGILDRTHMRLFTFRTIRRLLEEGGLRVVAVRGIPAPVPKAIGDGRVARSLLALNRLLIRLSRTLFSYQIFVVAEMTPSLEWLVRPGASGPR